MTVKYMYIHSYDCIVSYIFSVIDPVMCIVPYIYVAVEKQNPFMLYLLSQPSECKQQNFLEGENFHNSLVHSQCRNE